MAEQSISYNANVVADGGGGLNITQPFSPGDVGKARKEGSKNNLARYLTKAGVRIDLAQKVGELSVPLFKNMDAEGLHEFIGDNPMDRAIMRAAQSSLRLELASEELEAGAKRNRPLFEDEEEEEEEEMGGIEALAKTSSQRRVEDLRSKALASRKQPRSEVSVIYNDPYQIGVDAEGKEYIVTVYGEHSSDGTIHAKRMASLKYNDIAPKGTVVLKVTQLNVALLSFNKSDTVKRSEAASVILLTVHQSRWAAIFQNDWDICVEHFQKKAFEHWSLELSERTITGWTGIEKLKLVEGTAPLNSLETLSSLLTFKWTITDGLRLAMFEHQKGESRSLKNSVCNNHNEGVIAVIR
jgi:hypothetical protein